jgi:hypothetical protein
MWLLAFAGADGNGEGKERQHEGEGCPVADAGEERGRERRGQAGIEETSAVEAKGMDDPATGVDDRRDAGGGRADDRQPFLQRAEAGLRQMLDRPPGAEPGVVGGIEEEGGAEER